ncbi:MAG: CopG family antitoxin [Candidatus Daviesbacteria bacterium]|nr:CopG family antitoxin [Candidatus Daviesbacteria bacterium]
MNKKKLLIPDFKSIEEMASFWDTHDSEDYQWETVKDIKFSKDLKSVFNFKKVVPIRLDNGTISAVEKVAVAKGIGTSTAARMLIRERLAQLNII